MFPLQTAAAVGFWSCAGLVVYAYAIYPILIWALSRGMGRAPAPDEVPDDKLPGTSLLIAAHDEEAVIEGTLRAALAIDYPPGKFEVIVASDGSTDSTARIVRQFAEDGVRLLDYEGRRGKAAVLNAAIPESRGEIVLLSDANTHIEPAAARKLARWFRDPTVGAVCGRLVLNDPRTGRNVDSLYWRYETFLKRCEGRLGALLGANGAIYALRKDLYVPIPDDTLVDDFVVPLLAKLRTGCAIVYDPGAIAREETPPDVGSEFHRRARIGAGGFQSIGRLWRLLDPRRGWVAFAFLSHKVLRWLGPFFLIGALVGSFLLRERPLYRACLMAQIGFYLLALLLALAPARIGPLRPLRLTTLFVGMNAALLVGFWRWLSGRQRAAWRRTVRADQAGGVAR